MNDTKIETVADLVYTLQRRYPSDARINVERIEIDKDGRRVRLIAAPDPA